ncbi:MAG: HAMP domain-containing histidine kinase [Methylibium sp.]|nr:HAMP domain-containing histidine kinase [Methylibium sp.]MBA3623736.1 HAMP domain-containing histidine kinase [Methylibium sp.]
MSAPTRPLGRERSLPLGGTAREAAPVSALPSIRSQLSRALLGWSVVWGLAVAAAIMLAVSLEVDELLDETLQESAEVLAVLLTSSPDAVLAERLRGTGRATPGESGGHFAWQVVGREGLLLRSPRAPAQPLRSTPTPGFTDTSDWRVFGTALGDDGRMLYVAQTMQERREAQIEMGLGSALTALVLGLLGHLRLRARVRHELAPLEALSQRLAHHDPTAPGASLGPAEREELQSVHAAIDDLGHRLARRVAHERAFSAHAAHALRTPLAGIDAQLAVALRESPPAAQPRIKRAREAAARLQRVVAALLALFRSNAELMRRPVDLQALLARLPVEGLAVDVQPGAALDADADLVAAALLNLLDNALRYGAHRVLVSVTEPGTLRIQDDGPGVPAARRRALQQAVDQAADGSGTGLGLRLADLVARAHGGRLVLADVAAGFAVDLSLGQAG